MKIAIILPPLDLKIRTQTVARETAKEMRDFWAGQLADGKQPDGEPLPRNKKGQPLGRGNGTLVRGWRIRDIGNGQVAVEPYTNGRYAIAVARLRARGLRFQSFDGEAGVKWSEVTRAAVRRSLRKRA